MNYIVDDRELDTADFLALANQVWPGDYDPAQTRQALEKTLNITAQNCWFCRNISTRESGAGFWNWRVKTPPLCFTLAHSPVWKHFTRKTDAKKGCRRIPFPRQNNAALRFPAAATRETVYDMALLFPVVSGQTSSPLINIILRARKKPAWSIRPCRFLHI